MSILWPTQNNNGRQKNVSLATALMGETSAIKQTNKMAHSKLDQRAYLPFHVKSTNAIQCWLCISNTLER